MEVISEKEFDELVKKADESGITKFIDLQKEEKENLHAVIVEKMETPVEVQKHLLTKINIFLNEQIDEEMNRDGKLSNSTRIWTKDSFDMLDRLQHNIYGTKNVNVNVETNSVSHGQIAQKIRKIKEGKKD